MVLIGPASSLVAALRAGFEVWNKALTIYDCLIGGLIGKPKIAWKHSVRATTPTERFA